MFRALIIVFCAYQLGASVNAERRAVKFDPETTKYMLRVIKECITKTGANPNVIDIIRNGKVQDDPKFKEFFFCACYDTGFANDQGKIKIKESIELFPKDVQTQVGQVLRRCDKEEGKDKYDTLFKYIKCFQENSPVRIALL